jgi:hypothetical protein
MMQLEIACFSVESAITAANAGADRIEFCKNYAIGGKSPSLNDFKILRQALATQNMPPNQLIIGLALFLSFLALISLASARDDLLLALAQSSVHQGDRRRFFPAFSDRAILIQVWTADM